MGGMHRVSQTKPSSETLEMEERITLGLLNAVHENSAITQRTVAKDLGIALGLANAYLKRCVKKGLIKVQQVPANRYAYYLTPKGFREKGRLTVDYLSISFNFFRHARTQCAGVFAACQAAGFTRVALAGTGDLGEIATLCVRDYSVELVGFLDPEAAGKTFAGLPVVADLDLMDEVEALMVTDLKAPQETYDRLIRQMPPDRILAPRLLNITGPSGERVSP